MKLSDMLRPVNTSPDLDELREHVGNLRDFLRRHDFEKSEEPVQAEVEELNEKLASFERTLDDVDAD